MSEDHKPIVIDNGGSTIKAGCEAGPVSIFPTIVGSLPYLVAMGDQSTFVGYETRSKRDIIKPKCPIESRIVTNWDNMEKIWHHTLYKALNIAPDNHPVLLTEASNNPKANREKMTQLIFETFNVPAFYVAMQPVLALYASGRTTGVVVDSGYGATHCVPIHNSRAIPEALHLFYSAGSDLTDYLMKELTERGYSFSSADRHTVEDIKEKLCYVALDFEQDIMATSASSSARESYQLPDGEVITMGSERFKSPEILFVPSILGLDIPGIHHWTYRSILKCDSGIRNELFGNIVLAGGTTLLPGLPERLKKELSELTSSDVHIVTPANRKYSAWLGGSILAEILTSQNQWCTKSDYDEVGPAIVHRSQYCLPLRIWLCVLIATWKNVSK